MGIAERRGREKQEVRRKILDAARVLFASEGYDAVTMRRIAEAIEYSPATIYLHFADKDSLVRELCEGDFLELAAVVGSILTLDDPVERLRAMGRAYVEFGLTHPHHYRLMFMEEPPYEDVPETLVIQKGNPETDAYAVLLLCIRDAIARGLLRPELDDPELVAQAVWAGLHGVIALHISHSRDPWVDWRPVRAQAELMIDCIMRGILRVPERSDRTERA